MTKRKIDDVYNYILKSNDEKLLELYEDQIILMRNYLKRIFTGLTSDQAEDKAIEILINYRPKITVEIFKEAMSNGRIVFIGKAFDLGLVVQN